ncbi:hypothetical protein ACSSS7_001666 [Eimeria intestinalis]
MSVLSSEHTAIIDCVYWEEVREFCLRTLSSLKIFNTKPLNPRGPSKLEAVLARGLEKTGASGASRLKGGPPKDDASHREPEERKRKRQKNGDSKMVEKRKNLEQRDTERSDKQQKPQRHQQHHHHQHQQQQVDAEDREGETFTGDKEDRGHSEKGEKKGLSTAVVRASLPDHPHSAPSTHQTSPSAAKAKKSIMKTTADQQLYQQPQVKQQGHMDAADRDKGKTRGEKKRQLKQDQQQLQEQQREEGISASTGEEIRVAMKQQKQKQQHQEEEEEATSKSVASVFLQSNFAERMKVLSAQRGIASTGNAWD